ncbi:uncharacterized protein LOC128572943 isoform X2 [Nycticebus coucang]|uniref:uncharacterized protein LOC128572943 isoform X2 n=1 Tax=Nycticebus coucang TaxID=9470 RepID=UPI00234E1C14|nr:uncharacterized protein LOC128572943 isoform X2 [Nycticebus coucang]
MRGTPRPEHNYPKCLCSSLCHPVTCRYWEICREDTRTSRSWEMVVPASPIAVLWVGTSWCPTWGDRDHLEENACLWKPRPGTLWSCSEDRMYSPFRSPRFTRREMNRKIRCGPGTQSS